MSAFILQNNTLWPIFEGFIPSILLNAFFLIYVIRNKFFNDLPSRDNKITNELSAHISEINVNLIAEIEKNKAHDESITAEIKRILTNVYKKLNAKINTKITNELSAYLPEINSTFTAKLRRINNKLNAKLTAEIKKINSCDADYASEAQRVLSIVNNIEEACHNDFASVNASIKAL
ncbi:hypothetical protein C1645_731746 [Glomus cerebriforme]|uniref:Uncharacterized protein n=1 Tax=Glomus cerebriforme TaxID=658196 RepID=A0A397TTH2_9GLOM|nr:hypothetical protein C1645_731746 [Glomus cerebriforme]